MSKHEAQTFQIAIDMIAEAKGSLTINEVLKACRSVPEHLRDNVKLRGLIGLPSQRNPKRLTTSVPLKARKAPTKQEKKAESMQARIRIALARSGKKLTAPEVGELAGVDKDKAAKFLSSMFLSKQIKRSKVKDRQGSGPRFQYWVAAG